MRTARRRICRQTVRRDLVLKEPGRRNAASGVDGQNDAALMEPGWRESWYHVNDVDVHVIEAGCPGDPLLVLLHGFPEFWWAWRGQITPLANAGYHVVVPDLRGYNLSDAPKGTSAYQLDILTQDVVSLVDAMGADGFYLVGHDWGAVIGWCVAARYSARVKRAVLINGPHPEAWAEQVLKSPAQTLRSAYIGFFQLPRIPEAVLSLFNFARLKVALRRSAQAGTFSSQVLERYVAAWARSGPLSGMLASYRALRRAKAGGIIGRVAAPLLLIWGDRDRFLGRRLMEASMERCDRGSFRVVEGGSHWLHLEQSDLVVGEIVRFLSEN